MGFRSFYKVLPAYVLCLPLFSASQTFVSQGPAPSDFSFIWGPGNNSPGAVEAIASSPIDVNTIFVSGCNGGIWRTTNFGQSWTPLTDRQFSLSISSIVFDPSDTTGNTLLAGIGVSTNGLIDGLYRGGPPNGVLRSTNGGNNWSNPGSGTISTLNVDSVFANGSFMLAGVFNPTDPAFTTGVGSLFRSLDTGATFSAISVSGNIGTEPVTAIETPPGDPNTIYVAITRTGANTLDTALYQTTNQGTSFTPIFTSANSGGLINGTTQTTLKVATGPNGAIAVGVVNTADTTLGPVNDRLVGIFLSLDAGANWTQLDLTAVNNVCRCFAPACPPSPQSCGFNPGGQGVNNSFLAIDPVDPTIVYAGGTFLATAPNFALGLWQLQLSGANTIATNLTVGANNTQIHPDIREMRFSASPQDPAARRLLISTDGGLSTISQDATTWLSINGTTPSSNLSLFESYTSTYDANNNLIMTAAQDGAVNLQNQTDSTRFTSLQLTGDGINAFVNDKTSNTTSYYYSSAQNLASLNRITLPVGGTQTQQFLTFTGAPITPAFLSYITLNKIDPTKMAFSGVGDVLIAQDDLIGTTLNLTSRGSAIGAGITASFMSYGTQNNPDALIACTVENPGRVFFTSNASTTNLALTAYAGGLAADAVFDLRDSARFFIADGITPASLWYTTDTGGSFANQTANLPGNISFVFGLDFLSSNGVNALFFSGTSNNPNLSNLGVVDSSAAGVLSNWRLFGIGLPNTVITQLEYNPKSDSLLAGAFGRGTWIMYDVTSNFPQATVLQFGLAKNNSTPDTAILTGNRPLIKYGPGTLTITGAATYTGLSTVNAGRMSVNGSIPGNVIVNSGATLGGIGSVGGNVTVQSGGNLTPGNSIGTITLGSLNLNPGSLTNIEIDPTVASLVNVLGNATLAGNVQVIQNPGNYPATGVYNILTAPTITGSFDPTVLGGLPGFNFSLLQQPALVQLLYRRFMLLNGVSGNARTFGNYINTFGPLSQAEQLLSVLSGNTLNNALKSASPVRNSIPVYIADNNVFLFRALTSHFSEVHYQRLFDCCERDPCCDNNQAIWIDGFANIASQDGQAQVPGFHFNTEGVVLGYDNFCCNWWTYGLAAGYAFDHFDEDRNRGSGNINTVFVAPYSTLYFCDFFADIELLYAYNWVENKRHISFPGFRGNANSHYHINQFMPHLGFGYDFCCCGTVFEPFASFDWVINWQDDFTERGAAPFNVREKSHRSSMLRSELGLRAYWAWDTCYGDLYLRAVGGYVNRAPFHIGEVTSTLVGFPTSVTLRAFRHDQNLGAWGIAMMLKNKCGYFGMLSYDGEAGDGFLSNQVQLKLGMEF